MAVAAIRWAASVSVLTNSNDDSGRFLSDKCVDYTLFGNTRNFEDEEFELELLDDAMIDYDVLLGFSSAYFIGWL